MGFTTAELDDFYRFAQAQLIDGEADMSLEECLSHWNSLDPELKASVADICQGIADERAGRLRPLSVIDKEIRQKLGFSS